ncbi:hypothetical protein SNE40_000063 [Patella caerulea]|uniref:CUB domain-containing protein n=1 Tax=Patella caerulea TaxID=87958 RepID=A0AAN8Q6I6_PATCE
MFMKILVALLVVTHVVLAKFEEQKPRFKRSACVPSKQNGDVTSINYPGTTSKYPNNAECSWTVCPGTLEARVVIKRMDIEESSYRHCTYDALTIQEDRYCGSSPVDTTVKTNNGCIAVSFTSDFSIRQTGFSLEISAAQGNGSSNSSINLTSSPEIFTECDQDMLETCTMVFHSSAGICGSLDAFSNCMRSRQCSHFVDQQNLDHWNQSCSTNSSALSGCDMYQAARCAVSILHITRSTNVPFICQSIRSGIECFANVGCIALVQLYETRVNQLSDVCMQYVGSGISN